MAGLAEGKGDVEMMDAEGSRAEVVSGVATPVGEKGVQGQGAVGGQAGGVGGTGGIQGGKKGKKKGKK
jgi:hypothetical protein